jgi:hypothetical protein
MTRHTEDDFARAAREIARQPDHIGAVTNYQIARYLGRSPGGGLYRQLDEWRSGQQSLHTALPDNTPPAVAAMLASVDAHILSVANAIARDIAGRDIDMLRLLHDQIMAERDQAQEEVGYLRQRLAEGNARERALTQEVSELRSHYYNRSAQMALAAAKLAASLNLRSSRLT